MCLGFWNKSEHESYAKIITWGISGNLKKVQVYYSICAKYLEYGIISNRFECSLFAERGVSITETRNRIWEYSMDHCKLLDTRNRFAFFSNYQRMEEESDKPPGNFHNGS